MKYRLSDYKASRAGVIRDIDNSKEPSLPKALSLISVSSEVPIVVVYSFAGEHLGFNEIITAGLKRLCKEYACEVIE